MNPTIMKDCKVHGMTDFSISVSRPKGRCRKCTVADVIKRRRKVKLMAIEYKGDKCKDCDGVFHPAVFEFHHRDPDTKDFTISNKGYSLAWTKVQAELDKCDMLCANCHRIRHFLGS